MRVFGKILGTGLSALALAACAGGADFGRTKPTEFSFLSDLGTQVASIVTTSESENNLPMTEEEKQLRVLAHNIDVQTAQDNSLFDRLSFGAKVEPSDKSYYLQLRRKHDVSGVGLLNAFGNDVMRDVTMVEQMSGLSIFVTGADAMRLSLVSDAMAADSAAFSDAIDVILRVEDNGKVIDQTVDLMTQRLREYRVALEQAAFDIPERDVISVIGEALDMLEASVADIQDDAARHRAVRGELFARRSADLPV
jgi:hypothetical protein